ncbi:MAG: glycosyltransferase family 2 protein [Pseudomonadota bacterium]
MRALCITLQRNEGAFLLEWIAHHIAAGFTDLLIYSNDCDDGSDALLDLLSAAGKITHVTHSAPPGKSVQWQALKAAWAHPLREVAEWVMVSDIDEFLNIKCEGHRLTDLIKRLPEGTDAVVLPWRLFGHCGHAHYADASVTEQFTRAAPPDCAFPVAATFFKSLFRPQAFTQLGVHRPKHGGGEAANWVDGSGAPMPPVFANAAQRLSLYGFPTARDLVECNHYSLRSAESFLVKRDRGLPNRRGKAIDLGYWVERNFNAVEETSIARMRPGTAAALTALMAVPGVAQAHAQCVRWHRARIAEILRTEAGHRLFGQLRLASGSGILSAAEAREMVALYQEVMASEG